MMSTDPLFLREKDTYYYYLNDHLGTPQKLVEESGAVVWAAQYTAFGDAVVDIETVVNNLRFAGQYFDAETGAHYNWHRYYDPSTGRYISADPIGLNGGMNLYTYVQNKPIIFYDPFGLEKEMPWYNDPDHWTSKEYNIIDLPVIKWISYEGLIQGGYILFKCPGLKTNAMEEWSQSIQICADNLSYNLSKCEKICDETKRKICELKSKLIFQNCINNATNNYQQSLKNCNWTL